MRKVIMLMVVSALFASNAMADRERDKEFRSSIGVVSVVVGAKLTPFAVAAPVLVVGLMIYDISANSKLNHNKFVDAYYNGEIETRYFKGVPYVKYGNAWLKVSKLKRFGV